MKEKLEGFDVRYRRNKGRVVAKRLVLGGIALLLGVSALFGTIEQVVKSTYATTQGYTLAQQYGHPNYYNYPYAIARAADGGFYLSDPSGIKRFNASGAFVARISNLGGRMIATDTAGYLYVTGYRDDPHTQQQLYYIEKLDANGTVASRIGDDASNELISWPIYALAVDKYGAIYAARTKYNAAFTQSASYIQKFDASGNAIMQIGSTGSGAGQFADTGVIQGIATHDDTLYVVESGGHIRRFSLDGTYSSDFLPNYYPGGYGSYGTPRQITISATGVAMVGSGYSSAYIFDAGGNLVAGGGSFGYASGVAAKSDSSFYVATAEKVYTLDSNNTLSTVTAAAGDSSLNNASVIATGPDGYIYIADADNGRIQRFNRDGVLNRTIPMGTCGGSSSQKITAMTIDAAGNIYTYSGSYYSTYNRCISKLNSNGQLLSTFSFFRDGDATTSVGDGRVSLATDGAGKLFVGDSTNSAVKVFDLNGAFLYQFGENGTANGQFSKMQAVTYKSGFLYVDDAPASSAYTHRIQTLTADGQYVRQVTTEGCYASTSAYSDSCEFIVDDAGAVYFLSNDTVKKISQAGEVSDIVHYENGVYAPRSITVDAQGSLHILFRDTVYRYDPLMMDKPVSAPRNLAASDVGYTSLALTWQPPAESGSMLTTKYNVRARAAGAATDAYQAVSVNNVAGNGTTISSGLITGTTYDVYVSAGNADGYGPEAKLTMTTLAGPPKSISAVTFSEVGSSTVLKVSGSNLVGLVSPTEITDAFSRSLVRLNGVDLRFCSQGLGMTAQQAIDAYSSYYTKIAQNITDTPPCYDLVDENGDIAATATSATIRLPAGFDTTAEGTVSVNGSPTYTFNKRPDAAPTAYVNGSKPLEQHPDVSVKPVFSGVAEPSAQVTVTVHSDPVSCTAIANGAGQWSCAIDTALPAGEHIAYVRVVNPDSSVVDLGPYPVTVKLADVAPVGAIPATATPAGKKDALSLLRRNNLVAVGQSDSRGDEQGNGQEGAAIPPTTTTHQPTSQQKSQSKKEASQEAAKNKGASNVWWIWFITLLGVGVTFAIILVARRRLAGGK